MCRHTVVHVNLKTIKRKREKHRDKATQKHRQHTTTKPKPQREKIKPSLLFPKGKRGTGRWSTVAVIVVPEGPSFEGCMGSTE
jgi:hypothetical protein